MSNSALATYSRISPNRTTPRTAKIDTITPHCVAGNLSIESTLGLSRFITYDPVGGASCNYAIGSDGRIGLGVPEADRSWCSSNKANDMRAITMEIANDGGADTGWHMSDKAIEAFIKLSVDICKRYGFKGVYYDSNKDNPHTNDGFMRITLHCWYAAKAFPGAYFIGQLPSIVTEINKRMGNPIPVAPAEVPPVVPTPPATQTNAGTATTSTPSEWAVDTWEWAKKNKITDGSNPQGAATREMIVAMIKNYHDNVSA